MEWNKTKMLIFNKDWIRSQPIGAPQNGNKNMFWKQPNTLRGRFGGLICCRGFRAWFSKGLEAHDNQIFVSTFSIISLKKMPWMSTQAASKRWLNIREEPRLCCWVCPTFYLSSKRVSPILMRGINFHTKSSRSLYCFRADVVTVAVVQPSRLFHDEH